MQRSELEHLLRATGEINDYPVGFVRWTECSATSRPYWI